MRIGNKTEFMQAQACMVAHHQAIKLFRGKAHATLYQRQVAAYKKAQTHEHPGAPPVAVEANPKPVPDDDVQVYSLGDAVLARCTGQAMLLLVQQRFVISSSIRLHESGVSQFDRCADSGCG